MSGVRALSMCTVYTLFGTFYSVPAFAANDCRELLRTPDVTIDITKEDSRRYIRDEMCSTDLHSFETKYGADTAGSYMKSISGKGIFTKDSNETIRNDVCKDYTANSAMNSLKFSSKSIIGDKARQEYNTCILGQQFYCDVEPEMGSPVIVVSHHGDEDQPLVVNNVMTDNAGVEGILNGDILAKGLRYVKVNVQKFPFRVIINAQQGGIARACSVYVGPPLPPPRTYFQHDYEYVRDPSSTTFYDNHAVGQSIGTPLHVAVCADAPEGKKFDPADTHISYSLTETAGAVGGCFLACTGDLDHGIEQGEFGLNKCPEWTAASTKICASVHLSVNDANNCRVKVSVNGSVP